MRFILVGSAMGLALVSLAVPQVHAMETAPPVDATFAAAQELAGLIIQSNRMEQQVERLLAQMTQQAFAADPSLAGLNQEYPGVDKVFMDILRPVMLDELARAMPEYGAATAAFFAQHFDGAEIGELLNFWRSSAGQALLRSVSDKADFSAMSKEIVDQIDGNALQISGEALRADTHKAVIAGLRDLSSEQRTAIIRFGLTPVGRKMAKLQPEKSALDQKFANRDPSAEAIARLERELPDAVLSFMEAEDRKRAAAK